MPLPLVPVVKAIAATAVSAGATSAVTAAVQNAAKSAAKSVADPDNLKAAASHLANAAAKAADPATAALGKTVQVFFDKHLRALEVLEERQLDYVGATQIVSKIGPPKTNEMEQGGSKPAPTPQPPTIIHITQNKDSPSHQEGANTSMGNKFDDRDDEFFGPDWHWPTLGKTIGILLFFIVFALLGYMLSKHCRKAARLRRQQTLYRDRLEAHYNARDHVVQVPAQLPAPAPLPAPAARADPLFPPK